VGPFPSRSYFGDAVDGDIPFVGFEAQVDFVGCAAGEWFCFCDGFHFHVVSVADLGFAVEEFHLQEADLHVDVLVDKGHLGWSDGIELFDEVSEVTAEISMLVERLHLWAGPVLLGISRLGGKEN
jgi:hypothetical protein